MSDHSLTHRKRVALLLQFLLITITIGCGRSQKASRLDRVRKAAKQGVAEAQFDLGIMYEHGRGIAQDNAKAVNWYHKAAEQGFAKAQYNLGAAYAEGKGVSQDIMEAYAWFSLAATQNDVAKRMKDSIASQLSPEQLSQWERRANELSEKLKTTTDNEK